MKLILTAATLSLLAAAPASAQMMGGDMGMSGRSCVQNGMFVPCPPMGGMQPGMMGGGMQGGMQGDGMQDRRMTRREMREQRRMMRQQAM